MKTNIKANPVEENSEEYRIIDEPKRQIIQALRAELKRQKLPQRKLGEKIDMLHPTIVRVLNGYSYQIDTLLRILDGLGLEIVIRRKRKKRGST